MRVQVEELSSGLLRVVIVGSGGAVGGSAIGVGVRESWRGFKYARLRRLAGAGVVDLVTKAERSAAESVDIKGG